MLFLMGSTQQRFPMTEECSGTDGELMTAAATTPSLRQASVTTHQKHTDVSVSNIVKDMPFIFCAFAKFVRTNVHDSAEYLTADVEGVDEPLV